VAIKLIRDADIAVGNMEGSLADLRHFEGPLSGFVGTASGTSSSSIEPGTTARGPHRSRAGIRSRFRRVELRPGRCDLSCRESG
jgi:hypothetical protein